MSFLLILSTSFCWASYDNVDDLEDNLYLFLSYSLEKWSSTCLKLGMEGVGQRLEILIRCLYW